MRNISFLKRFNIWIGDVSLIETRNIKNIRLGLSQFMFKNMNNKKTRADLKPI